MHPAPIVGHTPDGRYIYGHPFPVQEQQVVNVPVLIATTTAGRSVEYSMPADQSWTAEAERAAVAAWNRPGTICAPCRTRQGRAAAGAALERAAAQRRAAADAEARREREEQEAHARRVSANRARRDLVAVNADLALVRRDWKQRVGTRPPP